MKGLHYLRMCNLRIVQNGRIDFLKRFLQPPYSAIYSVISSIYSVIYSVISNIYSVIYSVTSSIYSVIFLKLQNPAVEIVDMMAKHNILCDCRIVILTAVD